MAKIVDSEKLRNMLYYSDDAVNMDGEYKGLWVRWRAIEEALDECQVEVVKKEDVIETIQNAEISFKIESDIDFSLHKKEMQEIFTNILNAHIEAIKNL